MRAIQVRQPGGPEAMEVVELPVPSPKANEAVVVFWLFQIHAIFVDQHTAWHSTRGSCWLTWSS